MLRVIFEQYFSTQFDYNNYNVVVKDYSQIVHYFYPEKNKLYL